MNRLMTTAAAMALLALLASTPAEAMQDAGQTGFYDRDATIGSQGGGGGGNYNMGFTPNTRFLKKKGSGSGGGGGNVDRTDRNGNRGGAYD